MTAREKHRIRTSARKRHGQLKHYFISGGHNSYHPHFWRPQSLGAMTAAIVLFFVISLALERVVIKSPSPAVAAVVAAVLVELANADRGAEGVGTLAVSPTLTEAAQMKADDMAARGYFAHDTPDGKSPWYWFEEAGYEFRHAGENLAVYFSDSVEVQRAWMNSPLHRANVLGDQFEEIGIALAQGEYQGHDTTYVVQMFGTPAEASTAVVESSAPTPETTDLVAGAAAEAQPIGAIRDGRSLTLWKLLTAPKTLLSYIYMAIAVVVFIALILLVAVEFRRHALPHAFAGVGLLALIVFLLFSGTTFFSGELLIL